MSTHFCLTVRFLQPYFHGRTDGGEPEWPPSPLRVFQALIAAAASRWRAAQFRDYAAPALLWLEKMPMPSVIATEGQAAAAKYRLYVPDNVGDKVASSWSGGREASIADYRTEKDVRPTRLKGEAVHYLYPLPEADAEFAKHRETLSAAARSITHLGWGIDMVAANTSVITKEEAVKLSGERRQPVDDPSATGYRVPIPGTLNGLIHKHDAFLNRIGPDGFKPVPPLSAFRVAGYRRDTDPAPRPYAAFRLLDPDSGDMRSYAVTRAVSVAGMIRGLAGRVALDAGRDPDWVNQFVYGHHQGAETLPRFSYLPLPSIQPHVGVTRIRRVLIAEAPGASGEEIRWIKRLLAGQIAPSEQGRDALLVPLTRDGVLNRYVGTSDVWTTVTPIALPGCDDGKPHKRDKLFAKAFAHAGYSLSALADAEFRRYAFLPGGDDARKYQPRGEHYLRGCSVYHVRLRWRQPVRGPLAIGSGRHCGLGVFATMA